MKMKVNYALELKLAHARIKSIEKQVSNLKSRNEKGQFVKKVKK